jgi:hypothetical protein
MNIPNTLLVDTPQEPQTKISCPPSAALDGPGLEVSRSLTSVTRRDHGLVAEEARRYL